MKKARIYLQILILLTPFYSSCQNKENDAFENLENKHMTEILKNFPDKAQRWNVPAADGRLLYDLILKNDYKKVVEVGTSNGYSALWMGFALQQTGGKLITIEISEERATEARRNIREAGLEEIIEVRLNDARQELPHLKEGIDFVFLDADKSEYADYFQQVNDKINPGGAIAAHNVLTMNYAMRDFLEAIRKDDQFTSETYRKSSQGVLVAIKKE
jgi:predicted O-methyltransferase YrrM